MILCSQFSLDSSQYRRIFALSLCSCFLNQLKVFLLCRGGSLSLFGVCLWLLGVSGSPLGRSCAWRLFVRFYSLNFLSLRSLLQTGYPSPTILCPFSFSSSLYTPLTPLHKFLRWKKVFFFLVLLSWYKHRLLFKERLIMVQLVRSCSINLILNSLMIQKCLYFVYTL